MPAPAFLPERNLLLSMGVTLLFLGAAIYAVYREEYALTYGCVAVVVGMSVYLLWKNRSHELRTLPVEIFQEKKDFVYVVHGGPMYAALLPHQSRKQTGRLDADIDLQRLEASTRR